MRTTQSQPALSKTLRRLRLQGKRCHRSTSTRRLLGLGLAGAVIATQAAVFAPAPAAAASSKKPDRSGDSGPATRFDTSPPLSSIAPAEEVKEKKEHRKEGQLPAHPASPTADPVVQRTTAAAAPATLTSFDGVGNGFIGPQGTYTVSSAPPDTNSAAGPSRVVEIVNTSFAIFDKGGTPVYGPAANNTLWSGFGGSCQTTNDGDAVVRYDRAADRWIFTQFANVRSTNGPYFGCVAISQDR